MTGRDLVSAQLRLIGAIAPGEAPSSSEAIDALSTNNRMIDSFSNENLLIYAVTTEAPITMSAGDATYTLGTSGDISTRAMRILSAVVRNDSVSPAIDFQVRIISSDEYDLITQKDFRSAYPTDLYDDGGYPLRTLTLYPVPSSSFKLVLSTLRPLTQIATLDTVLSLPPGYEEMLVYNGAVRLSPEYGRPVSPEIAQIAMDSKASIKRSNYRASYLRIDDVPASKHGKFNIYNGGYQ